MLDLYPRGLKIVSGAAMLALLIALGISLYVMTLPSGNSANKLGSPEMTVTLIFGAIGFILTPIAIVWIERFKKHYYETEVFSGKTRIIHAQTVRDDTGAEVVELFCAVSEEDNNLKVFRVAATDTTRDYGPGDMVDLVWTGRDPHYGFRTLVQYAHTA